MSEQESEIRTLLRCLGKEDLQVFAELVRAMSDMNRSTGGTVDTKEVEA